MTSKLIRYRSFGLFVYSVHANGGEVKVSKHGDEAEAKAEASRLNDGLRASSPPSPLTAKEQEYLAEGRRGLLDEDWDG